MTPPDLQSLNGRWWDWRVESWDGWTLRLVADSDLTYHHAVEVDFTGVGYVSTAIEFDSPRFREPEVAEIEMVRSQVSGDLDDLRVVAWDFDDSGVGIVAAEGVDIREGLVRHEAFFRAND